MLNISEVLKDHFSLFISEDDLHKNFGYLQSLPSEKVNCHLKIKDDLILAGLPFFFEVFNFLSVVKKDYSEFFQYEGRKFSKTDNFEIKFSLPFDLALSGERLALNLLQRASSIATNTHRFVEKVQGIKILDTRKTTPGLRFLEKYAVKTGGGCNHRFSQSDAWMVKDNHKSMFGGVSQAIKFFKEQQTFYQPIIVEIHSLDELSEAYAAGAKHFLLDNFSPEKIQEAIGHKKSDMTFEVSGGITFENIHEYCIEGVDAFSSGSLTYDAPAVDLSLKFFK